MRQEPHYDTVRPMPVLKEGDTYTCPGEVTTPIGPGVETASIEDCEPTPEQAKHLAGHAEPKSCLVATDVARLEKSPLNEAYDSSPCHR